MIEVLREYMNAEDRVEAISKEISMKYDERKAFATLIRRYLKVRKKTFVAQLDNQFEDMIVQCDKDEKNILACLWNFCEKDGNGSVCPTYETAQYYCGGQSALPVSAGSMLTVLFSKDDFGYLVCNRHIPEYSCILSIPSDIFLDFSAWEAKFLTDRQPYLDAARKAKEEKQEQQELARYHQLLAKYGNVRKEQE